jgi:hypothetical protein
MAKVVKALCAGRLLPAIVFSFSRKQCESLAAQAIAGGALGRAFASSGSGEASSALFPTSVASAGPSVVPLPSSHPLRIACPWTKSFAWRWRAASRGRSHELGAFVRSESGRDPLA